MEGASHLIKDKYKELIAKVFTEYLNKHYFKDEKIHFIMSIQNIRDIRADKEILNNIDKGGADYIVTINYYKLLNYPFCKTSFFNSFTDSFILDIKEHKSSNPLYFLEMFRDFHKGPASIGTFFKYNSSSNKFTLHIKSDSCLLINQNQTFDNMISLLDMDGVKTRMELIEHLHKDTDNMIYKCKTERLDGQNQYRHEIFNCNVCLLDNRRSNKNNKSPRIMLGIPTDYKNNKDKYKILKGSLYQEFFYDIERDKFLYGINLDIN